MKENYDILVNFINLEHEFIQCHQTQFDEGSDDYMGQKINDLKKKSLRTNMLKGKRLNIFDLKAVREEAPETETAPSLWGIECARQLAEVSEQLPQNGFGEMIQWTREGKLWEFPMNNEAVKSHDQRVYTFFMLLIHIIGLFSENTLKFYTPGGDV
ncbi:unnamed protein product [Nyctereutes procyonoides]|uniref:Small ribosomal subunit protein mS31 n=1 Tax=Nyctereutes procyonoides TaxID=34880 RepID=A0A811YCU5_NYCPR|nr:unnamed protein product [Nyctereutes procyonoides]